jgi:hypothetical protein
MFCPNCGEKENNLVQFCRTCGANLLVVRDSLQEADNYTASAINAREEIARAALAKIKEGQWWQVGMIVPEVEKLFESPAERSLRQQREDEQRKLKLLRDGTLTTAVGFGLVVLFLVASLAQANAFFLIGPALLVLLIGLGIVINGLFFADPKRLAGKSLDNKTPLDASDRQTGRANEPKSLISSAQSVFEHTSVTENTTRHLSKNSLGERRDTNKIPVKNYPEG